MNGYEHINEIFAPWKVNRKVEKLEIIDIVKRAKSRERAGPLGNLIGLMSEVIRDYGDHKLGRLRNSLNVNKFTEIRDHSQVFINEVTA